MQPPKWKAVEGGGWPGGIGGDQRRRCVAASLSMLIAATLAFLAYVAFFPDDGAGGVYRWWSCQDCSGSLGEFPADEAAAADGPTAAGSGGRAPTTLSHIVFGIGASARTWDQRRGYAELWWRSDAMRGHVWLDEQPAGAWPAATCPPYRVSADASRFGNRASASRMARIVADSYLAVSAELANGTAAGQDEAPRWFVMGDDDTVFFPDNLVAVLRKYDHEEMYYVGAPSESVEQNVMHSYGMAFGGGGFAVSYPAAAELAKAIDGCLDRYSQFYGSDQRVQACLSELGIPLTREPGFHQIYQSILLLSRVAVRVAICLLPFSPPLHGAPPGRPESISARFKPGGHPGRRVRDAGGPPGGAAGVAPPPGPHRAHQPRRPHPAGRGPAAGEGGPVRLGPAAPAGLRLPARAGLHLVRLDIVGLHGAALPMGRGAARAGGGAADVQDLAQLGQRALRVQHPAPDKPRHPLLSAGHVLPQPGPERDQPGHRERVLEARRQVGEGVRPGQLPCRVHGSHRQGVRSQDEPERVETGATAALLQNNEDEVGHGAGGADTVLQPRRAHHAITLSVLLTSPHAHTRQHGE